MSNPLDPQFWFVVGMEVGGVLGVALTLLWQGRSDAWRIEDRVEEDEPTHTGFIDREKIWPDLK